MVSQYASSFMNAAFGWSVLPSTDLPAGGPAYPLSSLGIRMRAQPADNWTVLAGGFDSNPAGNGVGDPQQVNRHGTNFNLHNGMLFIGEVQYVLNPVPSGLSAALPAGLPGTYKLGFWYNTQHFSSQGLDNTVNPGSNSISQGHQGNYSVYAVADQMVWRPTADSPKSISVFARIMSAPGDRNLLDLSLNAGMTFKAPFKNRANDMAGLAVGYAKVGSHAHNLVSATAYEMKSGNLSPSMETLFEATYQYQITPWWQLQMDFQYVLQPAAGILHPGIPTQRIGDEAIVGIRTILIF